MSMIGSSAYQGSPDALAASSVASTGETIAKAIEGTSPHPTDKAQVRQELKSDKGAKIPEKTTATVKTVVALPNSPLSRAVEGRGEAEYTKTAKAGSGMFKTQHVVTVNRQDATQTGGRLPKGTRVQSEFIKKLEPAKALESKIQTLELAINAANEPEKAKLERELETAKGELKERKEQENEFKILNHLRSQKDTLGAEEGKKALSNIIVGRPYRVSVETKEGHKTTGEGEYSGIDTKFMNGGSADKFLAEKKPSPENVLKIAKDVVSGLVQLHKAGVIWGDCHPGNILLRTDDKGNVLKACVADFGTSRLITDGRPKGVVDVKLEYAPPLTDKEIRTKRHDTYSLGVALYQMFTGVSNERLFGRTAKSTMAQLRGDGNDKLSADGKTILESKCTQWPGFERLDPDVQDIISKLCVDKKGLGVEGADLTSINQKIQSIDQLKQPDSGQMKLVKKQQPVEEVEDSGYAAVQMGENPDAYTTVDIDHAAPSPQEDAEATPGGYVDVHMDE